jgi:hypothetical protein
MRDEEIHGRRVVLAPLRGHHAGELVGLLDDDSFATRSASMMRDREARPEN